MSAILDSKLAEKLIERLNQIEAESLASLPNGMAYDKYQQACGYMECIRQIRDSLVPAILEELQRS